MFSLLNIILVLVLLAINGVFIYNSKRKRKYGLIPGRILLVFLAIFFLGESWIFVFYENDRVFREPEKELTQSQEKYKQHEEKRMKKMYLKKPNIRVNSKFAQYIQYILRASTIQSLLAILYSIFGLLSVYHRNDFYYKMIAANSVAFLFCCISEWRIL